MSGSVQIKSASVYDEHTRLARAVVTDAPVWRNASGGNPIEPHVIRVSYDITDGRCRTIEVTGDKVEEVTRLRPYRRSSTRRVRADELHAAPEWVQEFVETHRPEVSP